VSGIVFVGEQNPIKGDQPQRAGYTLFFDIIREGLIQNGIPAILFLRSFYFVKTPASFSISGILAA
jgi:hypothetical protein